MKTKYRDNTNRIVRCWNYYGTVTCTGISFVDSIPLRVCFDQRILIHKTFGGFSERGKCSIGWFFGFKLHLAIIDKDEMFIFMFTLGTWMFDYRWSKVSFLRKLNEFFELIRIYWAGFIWEAFPHSVVICNFIAKSMSVIPAYCFFEMQLAIGLNFVNDGQLFYFFWTHAN